LATQRSEVQRLLSTCLSICPSHSCVMPTRFKISKYALHHTTEQFHETKLPNTEFGVIPERVNYREAPPVNDKNEPIIRHIMEIVQEMR